MTERSRCDHKNFNFISNRIEKAIIVNGQLDISPTPRPTRWDTPTPRPTHWDTPTLRPTHWDTPTPRPTHWDTPTPHPTHWDTPTRRTIRGSPPCRNIDASPPRRDTSPPPNFSSFGSKFSQNSINVIDDLTESVRKWWLINTTGMW